LYYFWNLPFQAFFVTVQTDIALLSHLLSLSLFFRLTFATRPLFTPQSRASHHVSLHRLERIGSTVNESEIQITYTFSCVLRAWVVGKLFGRLRCETTRNEQLYPDACIGNPLLDKKLNGTRARPDWQSGARRRQRH
jgi:hypothetical protein